MPDTKISALTSATTPLAGTEVLPIVQSGATVKVANNDLRPKQIQSNATTGVLQITGPAAGTTRVMTTPDANFTAARTDASQSFTGAQGINVVVSSTADTQNKTQQILYENTNGGYTLANGFSSAFYSYANGGTSGNVAYISNGGSFLQVAAGVTAIVGTTFTIGGNTYTVTSASPNGYVYVTPSASGEAATGTLTGLEYATERLRIDSSGNMGLGVQTVTSGFKLDIQAAQSRVQIKSTTGTNATDLQFNNTGGNVRVGVDSSAGTLTGSAYAAYFWHAGNYSMSFATNNTERIRITELGYVGVNNTPDGNARFRVIETGSATRRVADFYLNVASSAATPAIRCIKYDNDSTTANKFVEFTINQNAIGSGQINANGAAQAAFGTFSDQRLKENIADLAPQLDNMLALRPVEFDYKDGSGHQIGFIAQELAQVYPDAVGLSDGYMTVTGFGKIEARLIKAIQEQQTLINELKTRIMALENKG